MRILVDILHPAHVHLFKHAIRKWEHSGHEVRLTLREKDIARVLLDRLGLPYASLGAPGTRRSGLATELARRDLRLWRIVRRFRPHVLVGAAGVSIAHVGWLTGIPSVVLTDTENATLSNWLTFPFATVVCTPACYEAPVRTRRHLTYTGYHELAYLHPTYFTPDPACLRLYDLHTADRFIVMRLVAWGAAHDVRDHGFTAVADAVRRLSRYARVLVTAEGEVPREVAPYLVRAAPEHIHHLLAFAQLYIGESATMASESAVLGTPALFVSTSVRGYTNEQGRTYDLVYTFADHVRAQEQALAKAEAILSDPRSRPQWQAKRERLLAATIDVTQFIVDTVETYGREHEQRR